MGRNDVQGPKARPSRWLVVGIVLTALGLALTHMPGAPRATSSARATR